MAIAPAGWALTQAKRAYRFNEGPRHYLEGRFNIGQESGIRTDADVVAKEMRRMRGTNGESLSRVSWLSYITQNWFPFVSFDKEGIINVFNERVLP